MSPNPSEVKSVAAQTHAKKNRSKDFLPGIAKYMRICTCMILYMHLCFLMYTVMYLYLYILTLSMLFGALALCVSSKKKHNTFCVYNVEWSLPNSIADFNLNVQSTVPCVMG